MSMHHPMGMAKMGKDGLLVVYANLRVYGVKNLRIADGALMPTITTDDPTSAGELAALGLSLPDPRESGIFMSFPPGAYTAVLAGKNNGTGIGLVEVYNVH